MLIDIHKEVNECYLSLYQTGEGDFHLLPRVNTNRRKVLTDKEALKIIGSIMANDRKYIAFLWPKAVPLNAHQASDGTSPLYYHPDSISVALRVGGKWITNRGKKRTAFAL